MMQEIVATLKSLRGFAVVGLLATLTHYTVLKSLQLSGIVDSLAVMNVIGFCASISISYIGNRFFVFEAKHNHLRSAFYLLIGYLAVMVIHTSLLVGLTNGSVIHLLEGPLHYIGGGVLVWFWKFLIESLPLGSGALLVDQSYDRFSTTAAFLLATSIAACLNYLWNRLVVFQHRRVAVE